jgi:carboxymethylenebutenolidase
MSDTSSFLGFLDGHPKMKGRSIGAVGYCMGGSFAIGAAGTYPDRVLAAASFHGGRLVTDAPNSPHLLAPKMKARLYIAVASNDDQRQPDAKDKLREAFKKAGRPAEVEVYKSLHGWCVPDMPADPSAPIYNQPEAEKAWAKLLALYKTALV